VQRDGVTSTSEVSINNFLVLIKMDHWEPKAALLQLS
jgi:hypothetical protein